MRGGNYEDIVILLAIKNYFGNGFIPKIRQDTKVVTLEISSNEFIKNNPIFVFKKIARKYPFLKSTL